jgi:hypothetical protein
MGRKRTVLDADRVLDDLSAKTSLAALERYGCRRDELLALLQVAFMTDETWKDLVGMDLRALRAALRQIKSCADVIERLNHSVLINSVSLELRYPQFVDIHKRPTLSTRLQAYAGSVESLLRLFGPKLRPMMHGWKTLLVATVMEDAGRPCDKEVSAIMAATLQADYSEKAHQKWRLGRRKEIEEAQHHLRERRSKRAHVGQSASPTA